jgi:hypothetical protein
VTNPIKYERADAERALREAAAELDAGRELSQAEYRDWVQRQPRGAAPSVTVVYRFFETWQGAVEAAGVDGG